jgi:hypothetical protein
MSWQRRKDRCGTRQTLNYEHANTVRMNFEAWADAVEGRDIRILDAVTRSAAAGGVPITP